MKTIGILGGMSWESTQQYYQRINQGIKEKLGGLHSAKLIMISVDFAQLVPLQRKGDWSTIATILADHARQIEKAGADFLILATNTMHKVAPELESALSIPLLHIADVTAQTVALHKITQVGLLGTVFTMEQPFYKRKLQQYQIEVNVPDADDRTLVNQIIFDELCQGQIRTRSREQYIRIIDALAKQGAQGIILGCTEISLLVSHDNVDIPLFDTTTIHAEAAIEYALN